MKAKQRHDRIVAMVAEQGRASVDVLAELLGASRETIRRDLTVLSDRALIRKVHGGAVPWKAPGEDPFAARMEKNRAAKLRIGRAAAGLFAAGDSLLVDTGSTTIYFAEALAEISGLTVITNARKVADAVAGGSGGSEAYLLGGRYLREAEQVVGPMAVEQIQRFSADHAVLTVGAINAAARFMDYNAEEAYVARAMIESARLTTVLVDSSKFERSALFEVAEAGRVDRIVTDAPPPAALASALAEASVEIIIA
ncbi:MAG: DeoR/GlpR transcriptional regulator [Sphingomonadales bacterium]|nr:MAG: DeoR/GlpR transcriptional regulator [Sphingomonadales bacterium]